jgi:hypothetical protein
MTPRLDSTPAQTTPLEICFMLVSVGDAPVGSGRSVKACVDDFIRPGHDALVEMPSGLPWDWQG